MGMFIWVICGCYDGREAAIDRHGDAGGEARAGRAEEQHGRGDLFHFSETSDGMFGEQEVVRLAVAARRGVDVGFHHRGADGVDAHALRGEFDGGGFRQADDGKLARVINRGVRDDATGRATRRC